MGYPDRGVALGGASYGVAHASFAEVSDLLLSCLLQSFCLERRNERFGPLSGCDTRRNLASSLYDNLPGVIRYNDEFAVGIVDKSPTGAFVHGGCDLRCAGDVTGLAFVSGTFCANLMAKVDG